MPINFKDNSRNKKQKTPAKMLLKTDSKTKLTPREKLERDYMPRHSHTGFIVAIVLLILVAIAAPIGMFFWAKGVGWEEGRESAKTEYYDYGYGIGRHEGYNDGYNSGYNIGSQEGYSRGYNRMRCQIFGGYCGM